ncbi:MAG: M20/M25/M40 family metallo-hydrolase [Rhizorhabdus sp.]
MRLLISTMLCAVLLTGPAAAQTRPDQTGFRELYKELVETNTTINNGSCTIAAERMAARLHAAGFSAEDARLFGVPDHPREYGLIATLPGTDPKAEAILLLAHIDVVEAKREDWVRDPFLLVEENSYFYGRGTSDDKAQAAIFTDTMIRLKQAGTTLRRTVKLALTCGEETDEVFNGANWLATRHKDWIAAAFALNEGSTGTRDAAGKPISLGIQAGEKVYQDFRIEATNPGGHSARPRPDNAIYSLAAAHVRVGHY